MGQHLVVHVWLDVSDPWSHIGLHRLRRGIAMACHGGGSAEAAPAPSPIRVDVDVHAFPAPEGGVDMDAARRIAAVGAGEGLRIRPEALASPLDPAVRRTLRRMVYAAKSAGTDPADSAARGVCAAEAIQREVLARDDGWHRDDADQDESGAAAHGPGPRWLEGLCRRLGLDPAIVSAGSTAGRWQAEVDRDVKDAERLGIAGLPLVVIGGVLSVVGAQSAETFAALVVEAAAAVENLDRVPENARFRI